MLNLNLKSMKKVFFAVAIACVAFAFSSCKDSSEARCWKITYKSGDTKMVTYQYLSEDEVDASYGKYRDFKSEKVNKNESDCVLANIGLTTEK